MFISGNLIVLNNIFQEVMGCLEMGPYLVDGLSMIWNLFIFEIVLKLNIL